MYYTSYFAKLKKLDKKKYKFVSITHSKPEFCDDSIEDWSFLGPSEKLLYSYKNNYIDQEGYTKEYMKFLDEKWYSFKDFLILHQNENIVMLCYEKSTDFCHRHLLRKFLNEVGIKCEELE